MVNAPRNAQGILYANSRLYELLVKSGIEPSKVETISDDFRELKGRKVSVVIDSKGFVRL